MDPSYQHFPVVTKMKQLIKDFLFDSLGANLSDKKTLITDTRKDVAHFLGFEISSQKNFEIRENVLRFKNNLYFYFGSQTLPNKVNQQTTRSWFL